MQQGEVIVSLQIHKRRERGRKERGLAQLDSSKYPCAACKEKEKSSPVLEGETSRDQITPRTLKLNLLGRLVKQKKDVLIGGRMAGEKGGSFVLGRRLHYVNASSGRFPTFFCVPLNRGPCSRKGLNCQSFPFSLLFGWLPGVASFRCYIGLPSREGGGENHYSAREGPSDSLKKRIKIEGLYAGIFFLREG